MIIKTINSFKEYLQYTEKYKGKYYFRGQSNVEWNITPSFVRSAKQPCLSEEQNAIRTKRAENPKLSPIEALFNMQHYGTATRFCDLTVSHLSAVFFASEGETDGAVFVIHKDSAVSAKNYEIDMFSQVLNSDIASLSELKIVSETPFNIREILSSNYIINYRHLGYSNSRAFRQGGTGIIFGFGFDGDSILPMGTINIDELIIEKIIITKNAKSEITKELRQLGYSKEMLHDNFGQEYEFEDIFLTQTSFIIEQRFDKIKFNKITANYRLNTLYYNRDELALQIDALYNNFFSEYGDNARIWTFFYFDENDVAGANWICMGRWSEHTQYDIKWVKEYQSYRLNRLNEEISKEEAISRFVSLINDINPIYTKLREHIEYPDYDIQELFTLVHNVQSDVRKICNEAGNIPYTGIKFQELPNKAWSYINNVDWLVGDMVIFSEREDMKKQTIKWMLEKTYLTACEKSKQEYDMLEELEGLAT